MKCSKCNKDQTIIRNRYLNATNDDLTVVEYVCRECGHLKASFVVDTNIWIDTLRYFYSKEKVYTLFESKMYKLVHDIVYLIVTIVFLFSLFAGAFWCFTHVYNFASQTVSLWY